MLYPNRLCRKLVWKMSSTKQKSKKVNINSADSGDESEHELFYYANDRIRLMKEVLKLIKPKKIKAIAPDFMKSLDIDEVNSILLEELLGISNKRLKHILNGENVDIVSTSSESEHEQPPIDVISLDDISDTDDEFGLGSVNTTDGNINKDTNNKTKSHKDKKKIKEIKEEKKHSSTEKVNNENDKLMNVLEILELQARARAIRSQLALETMNKKSETVERIETIEDDDDDTAVIVSSPKNEEIVITSSDSEGEGCKKEKRSDGKNKDKETSNSLESKSNGANRNNEQKHIVNDKSQCSGTDKSNLDNDKAQNGMNKLSENESSKKVKDEVTNTKASNDSNNLKDQDSKICNIEKNETGYKSDSDNDVINLDSEDIENV